MMNKETKGRREFLKTTFGIGISLPVISFLNSCEQDEGPTGNVFNTKLLIQLSDFPELELPGGAVSKLFSGYNNGSPVIIIRKTESDFLVMNSECTHRGCIVNLPEESGDDIWCPCHGSKFSFTDGSVTRDPAEKPLQTFDHTVDFDAGTIEIDFSRTTFA